MTRPSDPDFSQLSGSRRGRATPLDLLLVLAALAVLTGPLFFLFFTSMNW